MARFWTSKQQRFFAGLDEPVLAIEYGRPTNLVGGIGPFQNPPIRSSLVIHIYIYVYIESSWSRVDRIWLFKKIFTTIATEQNGPCYEKLRIRIRMGIMLGIDHVIVIGMNRSCNTII